MLKPYDEYKETTCDWLEKLPSHWNIKRINSIFYENKEVNSGLNSTDAFQFKFGELIPKKKYEINDELAKTYSKYTLIQSQDIMINGLNLNYDFLTQRIALVKEKGIITSAYISLRPRENTYSKYYTFLFKSLDSRKVFNGMGSGIRLTLYFSELKKLNISVPPREEQDQIVKYLDWQTSKINTFIKAKKKQIELLKEQKQAVINRAVTKGLDDTVPMKNSGIEWLGEVPEHWEIVKLTRLLTERNQKNRPELQLLSVVREKGVIIRDVGNKEENHNFIPDDLSGYKVVKTHQFVMNKMKAWQGSYGISRYIGIVSPAYYIFDVNFQNFNFFHWAIRSKVYVNFFAQASDGIRVGQWDLSKDKMKTIPFFIPPNNEQQAIVTYLEEKTAFIDKAIAVIEKEIELVSEYKTSLISSVVTGKVNVSNVVVPDFEVVEDEISEDEGLEVNMDDSN